MNLAVQAPAFTNLFRLVVKGTVDEAKPYLTAVVVFCVDPSGKIVDAQVAQVPASQTSYEYTNVLGNPVSPWVAGTYTVKAYWNPNNGPGVPVQSTITFDYQA